MSGYQKHAPRLLTTYSFLICLLCLLCLVLLQEKFKREFLRRCPFCRFGSESTSDYNESKSMYTRATSIRSNFANASMRNNHHINQNYIHSGPGMHLTANNNNYAYMNSQSANGHHLNVVATSGKRFGGPGDIELKTTATKDAARKIVFQPVRTASLKNHHSAQNGPLLAGGATGQAQQQSQSQLPPSNDGLYADMDRSDAPLLSRIGEQENSPPGNGDSGGQVASHTCQSGVCLNELCPGIMFEDVDL